MSRDAIARNYAEALFELAERDGRTEEFARALGAVSEAVESDLDLQTFLDTPRLQRKDKKRVLRESLEGRVPGLVLNFLFLLIDRSRHRLLHRINAEFGALLDEKLERTHVEVSVARQLGDAELGDIQTRLSRILGREAIPHVRVRPELIGGIAFRSGDTVFDGSVRRRLQRMRRKLMTTDVTTDQG